MTLLPCVATSQGSLPKVQLVSFAPRKVSRCGRRLRCSSGRRSPSSTSIIPAFLVQAFRLVRFALNLAVQGLRLLGFALLVLPACLRIGWSYFNSEHISRAVRYGVGPRQFLDIYHPTQASDGPYPVVVAVMGGAWTIGHRLWNVLLATRLADAGVMVLAVDYRNFPLATIQGMQSDLDEAFDWILKNAAAWGGDVRRMALVGQSAGAHLCSTLLLEQCRREERGLEDGAGLSWSPSDFQAFLGVSGVYDMEKEVAHMESIGIFPFLPLLCAGRNLAAVSPIQMLQEPSLRHAARRLPPMQLLHGKADTSVPFEMSTTFASALREAGVQVDVELMNGVTHSHPVVEGPMGGEDYQAQLLLQRLKCTAKLPPAPRWLSSPVLAVASKLMPF
mmetsp:Transcript_46066/g.107676  ORF Transcript_46066/g.107676 Transcript_46066/m.107676 type:complete len:390 (-) Transcript_46066:41-1210(-)